MPTPEDKYYEGMNTLLTPVRAAKSLIQTLIIIGIVILIGLGYPLYVLLGGDGYPLAPLHVLGAFMLSLLTALIIVSLFYRPYYTILGGVVVFLTITCLAYNYDSLSWAHPMNGEAFGFKFLMLGYFVIGGLYKFIRRRLSAEEPKAKQLSIGEWWNEDSLKRNEQATVQAAFEREHRDTIENMKEFASSCRQPLEDALRGTSVLSGDTLVNANEAILMDIWEIWGRLQRVDDNCMLGAPQHLLKALCCVVEPKLLTARDWEMLICDLYPTLANQNTASPLRLPAVVSILTMYDVHAQTQLASKAAVTYRTVLLSFAALLTNSIAVKMVVGEYLNVLKPYINVGYADSASHSYRVYATETTCEECVNAYRLLNLPLGALDEEVKAKKHAFAELLHDDRLRTMSDNARRVALAQHQSVNLACDHILRDCKVRTRPDDGIDGNEPRPAPHQSASATTAGEKIEHQAAPASAQGESGLETRELGRKVLTEQELIDALDATRKKVDDVNRETRAVIDQMRKRMQM